MGLGAGCSRVLTLAGCVLACLALNAPAALAHGATPPAKLAAATPALPLQGVFTSCDISVILSECRARLKAAASAGLKVVVQGLPPDGRWLSPYLRSIKADGLRAMWEIIAPGWWGYNGSAPWGYNPSAANMLSVYPSWASACHCKTNSQLLRYIAQTLNGGG